MGDGEEVSEAFVLSNELRRQAALRAIEAAPLDYRVVIKEPKRTDGQNDRFHAMCSDIANSGFEWAGKRRNSAAWKVLLVSGHAAATKEGFDMVPGLEGEFVNIRESTALMSIKRGASLIEYVSAFCANNGIRLRAPEYEKA
jgi:hypothetical protein